MSKHLAIWIDHKEARIYHIRPDGVDEAFFTKPQSVHHRPMKASDGTSQDGIDAKPFFHEVARATDGAQKILVVGPSTAKFEFLRHVNKFDAGTEPKIVGLETVEEPTDGQLAVYAQRYFPEVG